MITYNQRADRYQDERGRFVSRSHVLRLLDEEKLRMRVRFMGHARNLIANNITLAEFQLRMAEDLKLSHIRLTGLAIGGLNKFNTEYYGLIGNQLAFHFQRLNQMAALIESGKMPPEVVLKRVQRYAGAAKTSFYRAEKKRKSQLGFNEARRELDPQAQHCDSCVLHSTNGKWLPISEVIPPGVRCECKQNCRCKIFYRRLI